MIDHYTLLVSNYEASKSFYLKALAPLGYTLFREVTREQVPVLPVKIVCGLGSGGLPHLWLRPSDNIAPTHIAFRAADRGAVRAFHEAALSAGGKDNGPPGIRERYHANYYGAYALDPDGNNVEVVCHNPE